MKGRTAEEKQDKNEFRKEGETTQRQERSRGTKGVEHKQQTTGRKEDENEQWNTSTNTLTENTHTKEQLKSATHQNHRT